MLLPAASPVLPNHDWGGGLFFLLFGLFTITMGYPHPSFGHVSFDRVAQIAAILVLGPYDAAWINGLASLLYPWHRLAGGASFREVLTASLNNSGLMTLVILIGGYLYSSLGGQLPLTELSWQSAGLLLLLIVTMEFLNDIGMAVVIYLRGGDVSRLINWFATLIELGSGLTAVLVGLVINLMPLTVIGLLLLVLSLGMLGLKQLALMRNRLEQLVKDRTRELHLKSLELERQATHDRLTQLFNRRYADNFLDQAIDNCQRYHHPLCIALADIDHFKQINDQFSHATGDEVLTKIAQMLDERCRKTDMVARYGGEEFLLCFPETDLIAATELCESLRSAVASADWSDNGCSGLVVTLSFGVAALEPKQRAKELLAKADKRLYFAKDNGRNQVATVDSSR